MCSLSGTEAKTALFLGPEDDYPAETPGASRDGQWQKLTLARVESVKIVFVKPQKCPMCGVKVKKAGQCKRCDSMMKGGG